MSSEEFCIQSVKKWLELTGFRHGDLDNIEMESGPDDCINILVGIKDCQYGSF